MQQSWKSIKKLEPSLRRFLNTRCRQEAEIDDVVQETFLRAAHSMQTLKETTKLRSWAFRIASNVLADQLRQESRLMHGFDGDYPVSSLVCGTSAPDDSTMEVGGFDESCEDVLRILSGALKSLRSRDRSLVSSFYGGDGSCRETAGDCSLTEDVVKVRLYRVRTQLRDDVTREVQRRRRDQDFAWSTR